MTIALASLVFRYGEQDNVRVPKLNDLTGYVQAATAVTTDPAIVTFAALDPFAIGDLIYASGATALSKLADVAAGNVLISGGVTTAPSWGKVGIATHVSGLGTGVATALAVNVGSTGAFVTFDGAGGTPSSLTLTNATGLPISGLVASTTLAIGVGSIELGHASDTTIARSGSGDITIEGNAVYRAGGTDVSVADGGTGRSTSTTAYGLIAAGTTATGAHQTLAAGATTEILVGGGASALPVWTTATGTGAPARAGSPTFTGTVGAAAIAATGQVSAAAGFRETGTAASRFENTGVSLTSGATGLGLEIFGSQSSATGTLLQSYNRTSSAYGDLRLAGANVVAYSGASAIGTFSSTGLDVVGETRCDSFRIDASPSVSVATPSTHKLAINCNGSTYYLLLSNV